MYYFSYSFCVIWVLLSVWNLRLEQDLLPLHRHLGEVKSRLMIKLGQYQVQVVVSMELGCSYWKSLTILNALE